MSRPHVVTHSRTFAVAVDEAYRIVAPMPLPGLFVRGFLAIPAIREVRDQTGPEWGTERGHSRDLVMADGGTVPRSWSPSTHRTASPTSSPRSPER